MCWFPWGSREQRTDHHLSSVIAEIGSCWFGKKIDLQIMLNESGELILTINNEKTLYSLEATMNSSETVFLKLTCRQSLQGQICGLL